MQVFWKRNGHQSSDYRKRFVPLIYNANPIKNHEGSLDSLTIHVLKWQKSGIKNAVFQLQKLCSKKSLFI